jgi:predicted PurR-regulated permease PerM
VQLQPSFPPLARAVIVAAAACIVVFFMRSAASIVAPTLLALFIVIVSIPPLRWMRRKGVPTYLAVLAILLVLMELGSLIALMTTGALEALQENLPRYQQRLNLLSDQIGGWLESLGIEKSRAAVRDLISPEAASRLVYTTLTNASGTLTTGILVLLIVAFMLAEASSLPEKLRRAFSLTGAGEERLSRLFNAINRYMLIKSALSLATGVCIWIWLRLLGIEYAFALGIAAALFNFIPIVGNILMTVPAVLMALVQADIWAALIVALGYVIVNVGISNILEPRWMGRELGISSVVVLLSLLFWGWVLGPTGLFLAVPLTMALMAALHASPHTRPIAIVLGPGPARSNHASDSEQAGEPGSS